MMSCWSTAMLSAPLRNGRSQAIWNSPSTKWLWNRSRCPHGPRRCATFEAGLVVIDTAPNAREMGASIALANLILVPCTPSGLDLDATLQTLAIIDAAREHRRDQIKVILVPNRLDRRTLEGRQLIEELSEFGEIVAPPIASRSAFVRCFTTGQSVASFVPGDAADQEIRQLADAVEWAERKE